jgi:ABC-type multidrug transport system fused ATPase/permease subunit
MEKHYKELTAILDRLSTMILCSAVILIAAPFLGCIYGIVNGLVKGGQAFGVVASVACWAALVVSVYTLLMAIIQIFEAIKDTAVNTGQLNDKLVYTNQVLEYFANIQQTKQDENDVV